MSFADLVKPMQTLCQTNSEFAECLFTTLLTEVLESSRQGVEEEEAKTVTLTLAKVITNASLSSPRLLSATMATLLNQPGAAEIAPDRLSQIASNCDLGPLAALTLEKALKEMDEEHQPQAKRRKENPGEEKTSMTWLQLSEVFKILEDRHSVVGVFSLQNNIKIHPDTGRALTLEANGDVRGAQELYRTLMAHSKEGRQRQEVELWNRGFFSSFAKLGLWDRLAAEVVKEVGDDLEGVWVKQYLMAPLLESHMHCLLDQPSTTANNNIFGLLNSAFKDKERKGVLLEHGATEVAALLTYKKHFGQALGILSKALVQQRLECFQSCRRNVDLLGLQAATELEEYLLERTGQAVQGRWRTEPLPADNLSAWDNILSLRSLYHGARSKPISAVVMAKSYSKLCNAALSQSNYIMVLRSLRNLQQQLGGTKSEPEFKEMSDYHDLLFAKAWVLKTTQANDLPGVDIFSKLFRKYLAEARKKSSFLVETKICVFTQLLSIVEDKGEDLTCQAVEATMKDEQDRSELRHLLGAVDLQSGLEVQLMSALQEQSKRENSGENHQAIAEFAFKQWRKGGEKRSEMSVMVVRHQMLAIQAGNLKARQLFPRILSLLAYDPSKENNLLTKEFVAQRENLAAWTLLPWINQLMAALHNEGTAHLVQPLVESLASGYPQATRQPFITSLSTPANPTARAAKLKLEPLLQASPLEKSFEQGLALLAVPHIAARDLLNRVQSIRKEHPDTWRDRVTKEYYDFKALYLDDNSKPGDFHRKFAKDFGGKLVSYFSNFKGGTELNNQLREYNTKLPTTLKSYSLFLASYQVTGIVG